MPPSVTPDWNADFSTYWNAAGDWAHQQIYCMVFAAWNERMLAAGQGENPLPQVGDDIQAASGNSGSEWGVSGIQWWIQLHCVHFINRTGIDLSTVDDVTPSAAPGDPVSFWTWNDLRTAKLPGVHGFTRKYPREFADISSTHYLNGEDFVEGHKARDLSTGLVMLRSAGAWVESTGSPDVATAYGVHQAGDYIGPWLFNEIRDCLNELTATVERAVWHAEPWDAVSHQGEWSSFIPNQTGYNSCPWPGGDDGWPSYPNACMGEAEDAWSYDGTPSALPFECGGVTTTGDGNKQGGFAYGCVEQYWAALDPGSSATVVSHTYGVNAGLSKFRTKARLETVFPAELERSIYFFVYAEAAGDWNDHGADVVQDKWHKFQTVAGTSDRVIISDWINPDIQTAPAWPAIPPDGETEYPMGAWQHGWIARYVKAIVDYSAGFKYTASSTGTCITYNPSEVLVEPCDGKACLVKWKFTKSRCSSTTTKTATSVRECADVIVDLGWVQVADEEDKMVFERWVVSGQACGEGDDTTPCTGDGDTPNDPLILPENCPTAAEVETNCLSAPRSPYLRVRTASTVPNSSPPELCLTYDGTGAAPRWFVDDVNSTGGDDAAEIYCEDGKYILHLFIKNPAHDFYGHHKWEACPNVGCPPIQGVDYVGISPWTKILGDADLTLEFIQAQEEPCDCEVDTEDPDVGVCYWVFWSSDEPPFTDPVLYDYGCASENELLAEYDHPDNDPGDPDSVPKIGEWFRKFPSGLYPADWFYIMLSAEPCGTPPPGCPAYDTCSSTPPSTPSAPFS